MQSTKNYRSIISPPSVQFISDNDLLRQKVLDLSEVLSTITGKITVIAVDGIDHAARSGESSTFLSSLLPPSKIPDHVCFFIVGQPLANYQEYPNFLRETEGILHYQVPTVVEKDIKPLLEEWYETSLFQKNGYFLDTLVTEIHEISKGNTLATVFAVEEMKRCQDVTYFFEKLRERKIDSGIVHYYQYIWEFAKQHLSQQHLDLTLIGVFSLLKSQVSASILTGIEPKYSILEWESILQKLFPIVIPSENGYYSLFHNDVRIFFQQMLNKSPTTIEITSNLLADYLLTPNTEIIIKHLQLFEFLKNAHREDEFIDIYTLDYVLEGIEINRPWDEMVDQLEMTLDSLPHALSEITDYKKILNLSCAVTTLSQLEQVLEYANIPYPEHYVCPPVFESERKVEVHEFWTIDILKQTLKETKLLCNEGLLDRAKGNINRWFRDVTPDLLWRRFLGETSTNEEEDFTCKFDSPHCDLLSILELWGEISQYTDITFETQEIDKNNKIIQESHGTFMVGWLNEGAKNISASSINRTLSNLSFYTSSDLENFYFKIIESNDDEAINEVFSILIAKNNVSKALKIKLVLWAIEKNQENCCQNWLSEIQVKKLTFISQNDLEWSEKILPYYCYILYIIARSCQVNIDDLLEVLKFIPPSSYESNPEIYMLLTFSFRIGEFLRILSLDMNIEVEMETEELNLIVTALLESGNSWHWGVTNGRNVVNFLLKEILRFMPKLPDSYQNIVIFLFKEQALHGTRLEYYDILWDFLDKNNYHRVLKKFYHRWMNSDGLLWSWSLDELRPRAEEFIKKAKALGWIQEAMDSYSLLNSKMLGYVGHKDYSFLDFEFLFDLAVYEGNGDWRILGVHLMNLSQIATDTGNNRGGRDIESKVSVVAALQGPTQLWQFARMEKEPDTNWFCVIFDGLMGMLKAKDVSEKELITIWKASIETFFYFQKVPIIMQR